MNHPHVFVFFLATFNAFPFLPSLFLSQEQQALLPSSIFWAKLARCLPKCLIITISWNQGFESVFLGLNLQYLFWFSRRGLLSFLFCASWLSNILQWCHRSRYSSSILTLLLQKPHAFPLLPSTLNWIDIYIYIELSTLRICS